MYFTNNDGCQIKFVHQPTLGMLKLKKDNGTNHALRNQRA